MCEIEVIQTPASDGSSDVVVTTKCKISGKPISITNEFGMWCEDLCNFDSSEVAAEEIISIIKEITGELFNEEIEKASDLQGLLPKEKTEE